LRKCGQRGRPGHLIIVGELKGPPTQWKAKILLILMRVKFGLGGETQNGARASSVASTRVLPTVHTARYERRAIL